MAVDVKNLLRLAPALQSASLLTHSVKLAQNPKKKVRDIVKVGTGTIVGANLIALESDIIEGFD